MLTKYDIAVKQFPLTILEKRLFKIFMSYFYTNIIIIIAYKQFPLIVTEKRLFMTFVVIILFVFVL